MTYGDIGALQGIGTVDDAMVHEILRELIEPVSGRLFERVH